MTSTPVSGLPGAKAFYPFFGMAAGAAVSFIAMSYADDAEISELVLLGRLHALVTAMIFWALGAAWLQGKEIYGGGAMACGEDKRNLLVGVPLVVIWVFSLVCFVARDTFWTWVLSFILVFGFFGEVGWRNPFVLVRTIVQILGGK